VFVKLNKRCRANIKRYVKTKNKGLANKYLLG
jgi:hypothetical protein